MHVKYIVMALVGMLILWGLWVLFSRGSHPPTEKGFDVLTYSNHGRPRDVAFQRGPCTVKAFRFPQSVLVRIHFAGLNPVDGKMVAGNFKLLHHVKEVGFDFGGTVQHVYPANGFTTQMTTLTPHDRVCGMVPIGHVGTVRSHKIVDDAWVSLVPPWMSTREAASLPMAALTADMMLDCLPKLKFVPNVLVVGGGAVGCLAVQIAMMKHAANVTLIAGTRHLDLYKTMNLHPKFVDYHDLGEHWARHPMLRTFDHGHDVREMFDIVVDTHGGKHTYDQGTLFLKQHGVFVTCAGDTQGPMTVSELATRATHIVTRNLGCKHTYTQVVCTGGDGAKLRSLLWDIQVRGPRTVVTSSFWDPIGPTLDLLASGKNRSKTVVDIAS